MSEILETRFHAVTGLQPINGVWATATSTDVVNCSLAKAVHMIINKGAGTTGTCSITCQACDDTVPTNTTNIPFYYQACTNTATTDAMTGAPTRVTAFTTTAGSNQLYMISVDTDQLAATQRKYIQFTMTEVTAASVLAGHVILLELQTPRAITLTQIT